MPPGWCRPRRSPDAPRLPEARPAARACHLERDGIEARPVGTKDWAGARLLTFAGLGAENEEIGEELVGLGQHLGRRVEVGVPVNGDAVDVLSGLRMRQHLSAAGASKDQFHRWWNADTVEKGTFSYPNRTEPGLT